MVRAMSSLAPGDPPPSRATWLLLALLLAGTTFAHLSGLGEQRLMGDELMAAEMGEKPVSEILRLIYVEAIDPAYSRNRPATYLVSHVAMRLFEDLELALRLGPALMGVLGVAFLFLAGRWAFGDAEGLIAALFLATSHFHLWAAREALGYAPMLAMVILSLAALVRGVRGGGARWWALSGGALGLAYSFHPVAALPGLALVPTTLAALLWPRVFGLASAGGPASANGLATGGARLRAGAAYLGAGTVVLLPALWALARLAWWSYGAADGEGRFLDDKGLAPVSFVSDGYANARRGLDHVGPGWTVGAVIMFALAAAGLVGAWRRTRFLAILLLTLLVLPLGFLSLVRMGHGWADRYLLFLVPGIALLEARGLTWLLRRPLAAGGARWGILAAAALGVACLDAPSWAQRFRLIHPPQDWGGLCAALEEEFDAPSLLLVGFTGPRLLIPKFNLLYVGRPELQFHLAEPERFAYCAPGAAALANWPTNRDGLHPRQGVGAVLVHMTGWEEALERLAAHPVEVRTFDGLSLLIPANRESGARRRLADLLLALCEASENALDERALLREALAATGMALDAGDCPPASFLELVTRHLTTLGADEDSVDAVLAQVDFALLELAQRVAGCPSEVRGPIEAYAATDHPRMTRAHVAEAERLHLEGELEAAARHLLRAAEAGFVLPKGLRALADDCRDAGLPEVADALEAAAVRVGRD